MDYRVQITRRGVVCIVNSRLLIVFILRAIEGIDEIYIVRPIRVNRRKSFIWAIVEMPEDTKGGTIQSIIRKPILTVTMDVTAVKQVLSSHEDEDYNSNPILSDYF